MTPRQAEDALFDACCALGKIQGIQFRVPPGALADRECPLSLEELCAASGLRHRKVLLRDAWWRRDSGPLLAFRAPSSDGTIAPPVPLACRSGRYYVLGPNGRIRQRVDGGIAAGLEPEAYIFYRPLPGRPLKPMDLLRSGIRGQKSDLGTLLAASVLSGLLALLTPLVTRQIVDSSIAHSDRVELLHMGLALAIGAVAAALFELARGLTLLRLKSKTAITLQAALWDRLLALPVSFFRRFTVGDLTARSMGIDEVQHLLTADVTSAAFALFSALFSLAILFYYSWQLALLATGSALLLAGLTALIALRQLRHLRVLQRLSGKLASLVFALLSGIAKLRVSGTEARAFGMWAERFREQRRYSVAAQRMSNIESMLAVVHGAGTTLALFAMIGLSGGLGIGLGDYMAFNAAFAQFQAAALAASGIIPTLLAFVPTYERMKPILEAAPESNANQTNPGSLRGEIELRNVSFRYQAGPPVLEDVSFVAKPGEFVAIVGPSGSGKSTCIRLMLGFERPETGAVLVDGREIDGLNMHLVRRQLGVVLQNGRPLVGDIFHNIIGSLPLSQEDAWRAARLVGLEEEIRSMPMGMFTFVNQRGVSFSGGQRQRLLLARAVVKSPRILLLDEATSAIDNRTQDLVTRNLSELGATRVVVAHRLSTIRHADRIYVLERGRIVDQGTFDELIVRGGLFTRMAQCQMV